MKGLSALVITAAALMTVCAALAGPPGYNRPHPGIDLNLSGTVTDRDGSVMEGVLVQLFVEGIVSTTTKTDAEGLYALEFTIDPQADETIVVWWVPPRDDLVPELALIRESTSDREMGLWGPCVPRIGVIRSQTRSVQLLDHETFRRQLARSGCLD
jgi:hypothetical protein